MLPILQGVGFLVGIGSLVCYVMVVIQMFQRKETTPAIVSLVGLLVCGLGALYAFIYGWTKASAWNIKNLMIAWTVCFVISLGVNVATIPMAMEQFKNEMEKQQKAGGGMPIPAK